VYVIELFDIVLPRRIRKELRKCRSYRGNSFVNLINQRINNGKRISNGNCIKKNIYLIILRHDG